MKRRSAPTRPRAGRAGPSVSSVPVAPLTRITGSRILRVAIAITVVSMHFAVLSAIESVETIAIGGRIREIMRLQKQYGRGRWRKLKGVAAVRLPGGSIRNAELHWYEAHGIGRVKMKIKRFLD